MQYCHPTYTVLVQLKLKELNIFSILHDKSDNLELKFKQPLIRNPAGTYISTVSLYDYARSINVSAGTVGNGFVHTYICSLLFMVLHCLLWYGMV